MRSRLATSVFIVLLGVVTFLAASEAADASSKSGTPTTHRHSVSSAGVSSDSPHATSKDHARKADPPGMRYYLPNIVTAWGSVTGTRIYFEDAGHACCAEGTLKDICPGDSKHVEVMVEVQVNNLEDDGQWVGSTAGHDCGYSYYFYGGDYNHSSYLFQVQAARQKLCRWQEGHASEMSCTAWTSYVHNPYA